MARKTIDQPLKKKIIRYLKRHSQNETAKHFSISPSTVNGIAQGNPAIKAATDHSVTKNAVEAHKAYAKAEREELIDKFLSKLSRMLDSAELKPGQMQGLAIALGTALDKRRLEEGSTGQGKAALLVLMEEIRKNAEGARHVSSPTK